jgi:hypothetical protein
LGEENFTKSKNKLTPGDQNLSSNREALAISSTTHNPTASHGSLADPYDSSWESFMTLRKTGLSATLQCFSLAEQRLSTNRKNIDASEGCPFCAENGSASGGGRFK